ncbi:SDR family oxidoreductase [Ammoniphilus sp. CFH 90114]|uniref:SDR family oxidoreductase n=1 Tax=Ammoniphilus sp. CFH 90114 TaxID=2493665 RepID=UPI00100E9CEE|nr:SDR family oxidoreductase [Ammoniphilus sp. CFH 90114]RXT02382.1 SDR family oxidoreductase [Ammoniphilus sp. CFH 90114]
MANKVAIVTGASSGIGEATVRELVHHGIRVMMAARREDRLHQFQEEMRALGGDVSYHVTDVTSRRDMEALAAHTIERFGRVDILVNNAGISPFSFLNKLRVDEWDQMIDVNIKGVLYGIAAVLPYMEKQNEGHIINVSSVAGYDTTPFRVVYSATKHAVRAITEGLRKELGVNQQIRTTLISPGAVETEILNGITDDEAKRLVDEQVSQQQMLMPKDVAAAIRFAIEQPLSVSLNEMVIRPTSQRR